VKVLITGHLGMLASATAPALVARGHEAPMTAEKTEPDIQNRQALDELFSRVRPDWVFNFAAFTQVDFCETQQRVALQVNGRAAGLVAETAVAHGANVLHMSTDYVFSGASNKPYLEDDPTGPLSVYGKSKLAGEQAIREAAPDRHLIVRTAWLYGAGGRNFVDTILRKAVAGEWLKVVDDQRGSVTWTEDLSRGLVKLMEIDARGTFHCTNSGEGTWYDVAAEIIKQKGLIPRLDRTDTESLARPAPRPRYSVLDCGKFERATGMTMPHWRDALKRYLAGGA
jgi:dTDP-4-dehydrorhamnose reductase